VSDWTEFGEVYVNKLLGGGIVCPTGLSLVRFM
jgi:hypothetical protein